MITIIFFEIITFFLFFSELFQKSAKSCLYFKFIFRRVASENELFLSSPFFSSKNLVQTTFSKALMIHAGND